MTKMKIEHIAIWVKDLEAMRKFYEKYFDATSNDKYTNIKNGFSSYFLSFDMGARIELMSRLDIDKDSHTRGNKLGYTHLAMSVGSKQAVDKLTERLRAEGVVIFSEPRTTGDGYYESVILDPEGNHIEITV